MLRFVIIMPSYPIIPNLFLPDNTHLIGACPRFSWRRKALLDRCGNLRLGEVGGHPTPPVLLKCRTHSFDRCCLAKRERLCYTFQVKILPDPKGFRSCLVQVQRRGERPFAPTRITCSEHEPRFLKPLGSFKKCMQLTPLYVIQKVKFRDGL